jgi:hypothetical protein
MGIERTKTMSLRVNHINNTRLLLFQEEHDIGAVDMPPVLCGSSIRLGRVAGSLGWGEIQGIGWRADVWAPRHGSTRVGDHVLGVSSAL